MYPLRVPLALPYWTGATYRAILRAIFTGGVVDGPAPAQLRSSMIEQLGVEGVVLCGSGSLALELALRACGVGEGDEVVIPTFCCTAVVPPIVAVGAIPVLADAGEELSLTVQTVAAALTEKTKAIVIAHLFGNPADIESIVALARERNIRVIDDAAQALGATIDGRPVGSFGDAGILSFGAEKVAFGLGGGVAVCREKNFLAGWKIDLSLPQFCPTLRNLSFTLIRHRWRRWTFPLEALFFRSKPDPDAPPAPYRPEAMANLNAAVALSLMRTLGENIAARRARVRAYQELLGGDERLQLIAHRPGSACLTQVVRFLPKRSDGDPAARAIEALARSGYEVLGSYVPMHLLPGYELYARGRLPHTEQVWADLIELPCEPDVSLEDLERITDIVKRFC